MNEKKLYTIRELAKITGISYAFLDQRARDEKIQVVKIGNRRMVTLATIEKIVQEGIE